ncbi:hypothetical protein ATE92_1531 [Ulvibacter sp. MAR_2010_11]|uniref:hypothetical protein n=1 Tax=Ulvibacter sp. MAR_2010_11 TaxID=1250229 RepID=UPI000CA92A1D|nr:hypothetical protein [Ulvibacter sp. MAR_2010_11]PKA83379.1 hypothetical protein ATE92_1531 [Ulvibacter sp. MAR_2010_11]
MKKITSHYFSAVILVMALFIFSVTNAQVGINITPSTVPALDATKSLDVNGDTRLRGDTRLDGALLPGNAAGGVDQMLLSQGTGTPPVWGPGFINTTEFDYIGKFYVTPFNIPAAVHGSITVVDADMTPTSVVTWHFVGPLPVPTPNAGTLQWGNNFRVFVEPQAGQVVFHITNLSNRAITGLQIEYVAFYNQ